MKIEKLTKMILISILLYLNEKFAVKQQLDAKLCAPFFKVFPLPCNLYLLVACEIDFRKDPCVLCIKYFRVCVGKGELSLLPSQQFHPKHFASSHHSME